jgi:hypothetical protein
MDFTRFKTSRWRMAALLLFVNLFIIALVWISLDASYRQYHDRAEISSRNTNKLVSQSIAGDIDYIDLALRGGADEVARMHGSGESVAAQSLDPFLGRLQSRLPMADSLRLTDAHGIVIAGSDGAPPGVSLGDRDYSS